MLMTACRSVSDRLLHSWQILHSGTSSCQWGFFNRRAVSLPDHYDRLGLCWSSPKYQRVMTDANLVDKMHELLGLKKLNVFPFLASQD